MIAKFFFLLIPVALSINAHAELLQPRNGKSIFELKADHFSSNQNYDDKSELVDLPNDQSIGITTFTLYGRYDITSSFSFIAEAPMAYVISDTPDETRERFGVQSVGAGLRYSAIEKMFLLLPEIKFSYPTSFNEEDGDEVYIGESTWSFTPGVYFGKTFKYFNPYLYLGYSLRGDGRSYLLPWSAHVESKYGMFLFGIEFFGFQSVKDDDETGSAEDRLSTFDRVNAGSFAFDSVNPDENNVKGWIGLGFENGFSARAGYRAGMSGTRSAHGTSFFVSLVFEGKAGPEEELPPLIYQDVNAEETEEEDKAFKVESYESEKVFEKALKPETPKKIPKPKRKKQDDPNLKVPSKKTKGT